MATQAGKIVSFVLAQIEFLDNVDNGVAKSYSRQSKQRKYKQLSYVYCATDTGGFLFWLLN